MTRSSKLASATAIVACAAALAVPATAGATTRAGDASFQQVYPDASGLCARVAAGTEHNRLKRYAPQVLADCAALQSTYSSATATVLAARTVLTPQIAADKRALAAACRTSARRDAACRRARPGDSQAIAALKAQLHGDVSSYHASLEAGRRSFWHAIHALRGESKLPGDKPVPQFAS